MKFHYHTIVLVLIALVSGLAGCKSQQVHLQTSPLSISVPGRQIIPLTFHRDVPIVKVMINGKGPFNLMVDSTMPFTCLTPQTVENLNPQISPFNNANAVEVRGKILRTNFRRLDQLQLGGVTIRNLDIGTINVENNFFDSDTQIDGVLSLRSFLHALPTLDYPNKQMIVTAYKPLNRDDPHVVQTMLLRSLVQKMDLYVVDRKVHCIVSTACPFGMVFTDLTGAGLSFTPIDPDKSENYITPYADMSDNPDVVIIPSQLDATIFLGGHRISQPIVHNVMSSKMADATEEELEELSQFRFCVLGGQLLKHFAVTFDIQNSRMLFSSPSTGPIQLNPTPEPSDKDKSVASLSHRDSSS